MADDGLTTGQQPVVELIDDLLGNREGATARITTEKLAAQLSETEALAAKFSEHEDLVAEAVGEAQGAVADAQLIKDYIGGAVFPIGAVAVFPTDSVPSTFLAMEGQAVTSAYPDLRQLLIDGGTLWGTDGSGDPLLPDTRGEFIRGWDNERDVDSGRELGSSQADQFAAHTHTIPSNTNDGNGGTYVDAADTTAGTLHTPVTGSTGGTETRPRNIAMIYAIKAFHAYADLSGKLIEPATIAEMTQLKADAEAAVTAAEEARSATEDLADNAEAARDVAELAAGVVSRATSVAGLTDPATLAEGDGGLVSGSGSSSTDGIYEIQSSTWVRIMALDYASADQGKIAEAAAPGSVIQRTGTGQWIGFPDAAGFSAAMLGAGGAYGGALVPTGYSWGLFPDQVQMNGLAIRKGEDAVTRLALVDPAGFAKEFVSLDEIEALLAEMQAQIDALDGAEPAVVRGLDTGPTGLHLIREHMAVYRYSSTGIPKLALLGDSWFERNHIPDRLLYDIMQSRFGKGGSGFLSAAQTSYVLGGAALVLSGFTVHDISSERAAPSGPYGLSGDWIGTGGTAATATLTFWGSSLNIYYQDDDGTFRYSTDGGSTWTEVAGGGTGAAAKVTISGLGTSATNSIQIDTSTNAGTVRISGFYATGKAGLEISKCGNSDSRATDWSLFVGNDMCALILDDIQPHAGIVLLGTNDVLGNVTPAQFQTGLEDIITACQTARAACGIALASSPRSEASGTYSMTDYRDVTFDLSEASAYVEAIDMVSHFGPYATSATVTGFWQDTRHLSHGGGRFWSELIYEAFFNLF